MSMIEIEAIREDIEKNGIESAFWNTFDAYVRVICEYEWDEAVELMPEKVRGLAEEKGFDCTLDWDYWGTPSFFGLAFDKDGLTQDEIDVIESWYEEDDDAYTMALTLIEDGMWRIVQDDSDYENFRDALAL
jgi:hypothetical protein